MMKEAEERHNREKEYVPITEVVCMSGLPGFSNCDKTISILVKRHWGAGDRAWISMENQIGQPSTRHCIHVTFHIQWAFIHPTDSFKCHLSAKYYSRCEGIAMTKTESRHLLPRLESKAKEIGMKQKG